MTADEAVLRALAAHGRVYLLWELDATGSLGQLDFSNLVAEEGIEDDPVGAQVATYIAALDDRFERMAEDDYQDWRAHAEEAYGPVTDVIIDFVEGDQ